MSTFAELESSRTQGQPVSLYLLSSQRPSLETMLRSVVIGPGATEFGYGTTRVTKDGDRQNFLSGTLDTDFIESIELLGSVAEGLYGVTIPAAWQANDLRLGVCEIRPKNDTMSGTTSPYAWRVGSMTRGPAGTVTQIDGKPAVGGAPSDRSLYEGIVEARSRGLRVTLSPTLLMDIGAGNGKTDPYTGAANQEKYPWRGRLTCSPAPGTVGTVDKTFAAAEQMGAFFGTATASHFSWDASTKSVVYTGPNEWSYRRFILHMATIAKAAGATDFLLGSELIGMTNVRSSATAFPGVTQLVSLAAQARTILGSGVQISYGANWSEYGAYVPADGSGDVFFNLDPLWSAANIDYIGINNAFPLADWRDGPTHLDALAGYDDDTDADYLRRNVEGGEHYDWIYATLTDRNNQVRTPIVDSAGEPWAFRRKDMRGWWANPHHNRPGGVRSASPTSYIPQAKQIVFTELACTAIHRAANQPNVSVQTYADSSRTPFYSNGRSDPAIQRAYLEAQLAYWYPPLGLNPTSTVTGLVMIQWRATAVVGWDARPYPAFPRPGIPFWPDSGDWEKGYFLTGRLRAGVGLGQGVFPVMGFTNCEFPVTRDGITYEPIAIEHSEIEQTGSGGRDDLKIDLQRATALDDAYIAYPPPQVIQVTIFEGHYGEPDLLRNWPPQWAGRILSVEFNDSVTSLTCETTGSALQRPGLTRDYQYTCPHALYGPACRASRKRATTSRTVASIVGNLIALTGSHPVERKKYLGGTIAWTNGPQREMATIAGTRSDGKFVLRGQIRSLAAGATVELTLGCNHEMSDCIALHNNIANFGGQPFIPDQNPLKGSSNQFY